MNMLTRMLLGMARLTAPGQGGVAGPYGSDGWVGSMGDLPHVTDQTAMTLSGVYRAVSIISTSVAQLPWREFSRTDQGRSLTGSTVDRLLNVQPCPELSAFQWRELMLSWALTWGNAVAEIEVDKLGRPLALWPLEPNRMTIGRDQNTGDIIYKVRNRQRTETILRPHQVFHLRGLGFDGVVGYSPIALARRTVSTALAAEKYGQAWFANSGVPAGVLEHPAKLGKEGAERLREDWERMHKGPVSAGRTAVLEGGMTYKTIGLPPGDVQWLDTRRFTVLEIARWFGIPPHLLFDLERATFSNIEHQSIEFVRHSLMPWIVRLEQEADAKLLAPQQRRSRYTKLNANGLLRGDTKSRGAFYRLMHSVGAYSANDILELEDENPIPSDKGGDAHFVPVNTAPLDKAARGEMGKQAAKPPAAKPKPPDGKPEPPDADDVTAALERLSADVARRWLDKEARALTDAAKRHRGRSQGFGAWAVRFFDGQAAQLAENLHQLTEAMAPALGVSVSRASLQTLTSLLAQDAMDRAERYFAEPTATSWYAQDQDSAAEAIGRQVAQMSASMRDSE